MDHEFLYHGESCHVKVERKDTLYQVTVGERVYEVNASSLAPGMLSLVLNGRSVLVHTARDDKGRIVCIGGVPYRLSEPTDEVSAGSGSAQGGDGKICTPMPGKIVTVHVKEGDAVEKDQPLLVVESMKMQNDILSDVKGVVEKVHFNPGDQASFGDPLVEIKIEKE